MGSSEGLTEKVRAEPPPIPKLLLGHLQGLCTKQKRGSSEKSCPDDKPQRNAEPGEK